MTTTIKTEGFKVPGSVQPPPRPSFHRPFSDGSMTVETDMLASLDQSAHFAMTSPFSFAQSLPTQPTFDHYLDPHSSSPHVNSFHPGSVFDNFKFGLSNDNPEPPINLSANERVRSQSASRSSHIGKAPTARSRPTRKLSLSEARPPSAGLQQRGRSVQSARTQTMSNHPRTMSQSDVFAGRLGLGIGLDTHKEGERTDSVTPPDFGLNGTYGVSIPRNQAGDAASWGSAGSAPSLLPGSIGSYGGNNDEAITESPMTPAHRLPTLPTDETYKKQRRRECHNQVEKRRREHINAKIEELSQLLPANYSQIDEAIGEEDEEDDDIESPIKKKTTKRSGSSARTQKDAAQCKGRILSSSVQYIHDLKHITDMHGARIRHLEALLMSTGFHSMPLTAPFSWTGPTPGPGPFQPELPTQLEVMRPSPEPPVWPTGMIGYEPSPMDLSSNPVSVNFRRSSSLSTSESLDLQHSSPRDTQSPGGTGSDEKRGRQREKTRKGSAMDIQVSMDSMDLDPMFAGATRRNEEAGGMRW